MPPKTQYDTATSRKTVTRQEEGGGVREGGSHVLNNTSTLKEIGHFTPRNLEASL